MHIKPLVSAYQYALNGINKGFEGLRKNAAEIANPEQLQSGSPSKLTQPLIETITSKRQVEASAKAISRVDQALGSLLDEIV